MIMITIQTKDFNQISQESYDFLINSIQLHQLHCGCCSLGGCLTFHGSYTRKVKAQALDIQLKVARVKCSHCRATHALIPSWLVPYSQIPLSVQQQAVLAYENGSDRDAVCVNAGSTDENNIKYIIRQYRLHWKERLRSEKIRLTPLLQLVQCCFSLYSRQFMQIRRTCNSLFVIPT